MLVNFIDIGNMEKTLKRHGLTYENGVISGELVNFSSNSILAEDVRYYSIIEAYNYFSKVTGGLGMYVGNYSTDTINQLESKGYFVSKTKVLVVPYLTYAEYIKLNDIVNNKYADRHVVEIMDNLLEHWPTIELTRKCLNIKEVLDKDTVPLFNFEDGQNCMLYHMELPIPFDDNDTLNLKGYVRVEYGYGTDDFHYYVKIGNHPIIFTNLKPTPSNIEEILRGQDTWLDGLNRLLKGIKRKMFSRALKREIKRSSRRSSYDNFQDEN